MAQKIFTLLKKKKYVGDVVLEKKLKKMRKLSYQQLLEISNSDSNYAELGKKYNVNEKTIRRNLKEYNLKKVKSIRVGKYKHLNRFGNKAPDWKGGRFKGFGYIFVYQPTHPYHNKKGYVKRSRLIMEQHLGRYLKPNEVIHHINGIKDDDKIENLELFQDNSKHIKLHTKERDRNDKGIFIPKVKNWDKEKEKK